VADHAAHTLEDLGHHVVPGVLSCDPEVMRRAISVIHAVDNAATFTWLLEELGRRPEPDELDPVTWDMLNEGLELTALDHITAIDDLHAQARRATRVFTSADILLCPTLNVLPPPPGALSSSRGSVDAFFDVEFASTGATAVANATGWAAITLPLGEVDGLPVGVQMMAVDEAVLLRVAAQLEEAVPWAGRHPDGFA
jgi:amidase